MGNSRIQLRDTLPDAIIKMSDGNPGALTVMAKIHNEGAAIDPDSCMGWFGVILSLDTECIYGPDIWMFYKDVCGEDLRTMLGLLRAVQLGFLPVELLRSAIQNYGKGIDIPDLMKKVEDRLPQFARAPEKKAESA